MTGIWLECDTNANLFSRCLFHQATDDDHDLDQHGFLTEKGSARIYSVPQHQWGVRCLSIRLQSSSNITVGIYGSYLKNDNSTKTPTEAPVEPTETSTDVPTEAPVEPTEAPVEPTETSTDGIYGSYLKNNNSTNSNVFEPDVTYFQQTIGPNAGKIINLLVSVFILIFCTKTSFKGI